MAVTAEILRDATKAGKLPEKTKKPKVSAALSDWKRYEERLKERERKIKEMATKTRKKAAEKKAKENIIKKYR